MKIIKKTLILMMGLTLTTGLALNFIGCTKDSSMSPQNADISENLVESNIGKITILSVDRSKLSATLLKGMTDSSEYYGEKFIKAQKGGKIEIGDKEDGKSKLEFPRHALTEDTTILFDWAADGTLAGTLNNVEFGPHGPSSINQSKSNFP